MGDEDDYVCEVNLKDAPISITHHLEVLGECFDYKMSSRTFLSSKLQSSIYS